MPLKRKHAPTAKLSIPEIRRLKDLYQTGDYSYADLARWFGLHRSTVCRAINDHTFQAFEGTGKDDG